MFLNRQHPPKTASAAGNPYSSSHLGVRKSSLNRVIPNPLSADLGHLGQGSSSFLTGGNQTPQGSTVYKSINGSLKQQAPGSFYQGTHKAGMANNLL